ncbi:hypothetical protein AMS68_002661 [Peltaster fructicola]|uniref:TUG ubiquitin-like domain-containing protein n=1 Tax=Peltaster fructicola TaxID=286661 RepID=A0A6H0XQY7_9PEZI|nr:hypothetical protein AMS68_002661 [Peltaster fructicola]
MASVFVVDSSFKRTQIKVTPGKYLREILEEACKSRKLNAESYTLKTQSNKILDLSQPFRLSGLTAGAKLQLVQASRSPSVVSVALQLPEDEGGTRVSDKFASNTSLWLVLRKFEEGVAGQTQRKLNLTQQGVPSNDTGAGRLLYRQPCLNTMGRSLETFADLQKTLAQLGFSNGTVLFRLAFKDTERPLEEAMAEISQYFEASVVANLDQSATVVPKTQTSITNIDLNAEESAMTSTPATEHVESDAVEEMAPELTMQSTEPAAINTVNGMAVFLPPSSNTPAAALHEEDQSVYEPSVDDARLHQAALTKAGRNTRLPSDKELQEQEDERQARLSVVQQVDIRIRYPDQSMIETTFYASDTAAGLYAKVRETLRHHTEPFELRYAGSKGHQTVPDDASKRLVRDLSFRGKVLVTVIWTPQSSQSARTEPSLKDQFRSKAQELKVNLEQQTKDSVQAAAPLQKKSNTDTAQKGKGDLEAKMKKFLGFGKK